MADDRRPYPTARPGLSAALPPPSSTPTAAPYSHPASYPYAHPRPISYSAGYHHHHHAPPAWTAPPPHHYPYSPPPTFYPPPAEPLAYPPTSAAAPEPTASPYFIPDDSHSPTTRGAGVPYSPPATRKRSRSSDTRRSSPAAASGATSPAAGTDKEATRRIRNAEASARCRYKKRQKEKKDHDRFTDMELQINKIWSKIVLYEAGNTDEGLNLLFSDKSTPDDIVRRLTTKVDRLINENRNLRLQIEALQAST